MRQFVIGNRVINDDSDAFIVAEIGHNHQGSVEKAELLFKNASNCGVDAVKLQKRHNKTLYTKSFYNMPYDNPNSFGDTYGEHREALELGKEAYSYLKGFADGLGLIFFATAFDEPSADFLEEVGVSLYKISSADLINLPLLRYVAKFGKPMIISTGGHDIRDIDRAVDLLEGVNKSYALLHCVASYPNEPQEMNLRVIQTLRDRYQDTVIGLSDHFNGIMMGPPAYVYGGRIFEKHFTLSHVWKGTDHALSLEPNGMKKFVRDLKRMKLAIGDGVKRVLDNERKPIHKMTKGLYASRELPPGAILSRDDIVIRTPGADLPPHYLDFMVGKQIKKEKKFEEPFRREDVDGL